jgi:hypothetical protein
MGHQQGGIYFRERGYIRGACALLALALAAAVLAALLHAPAAEAQPRPFYGVAPQGTLVADDYDRMRNGRVGTVRFLLLWRGVETSPGSYSWSHIDSIVGNSARRGIRALPFVFGPPSHVRTPPTRPRDRRAFRGFMRVAAQRYGPGGAYWRGPYQATFGANATPRPVRSWQLFNEQNGRHFWGGRPAPRAYGRLVKMGAAGVRSENPKAEIVLGGMFFSPGGQGSIRSPQYLRRLYRVNGIKRAFNTVGVHPYAGTLRGIRRQMRRIRNVMRQNNDRTARIRVTEIGWGSARGRHRLNKGPQGQARMLRRSFRLLTRHRNRRQGWNVAGVNWFSWQDGGTNCPFCPTAGLFSGPPNDRTPKRAWGAFRQFTR